VEVPFGWKTQTSVTNIGQTVDFFVRGGHFVWPVATVVWIWERHKTRIRNKETVLILLKFAGRFDKKGFFVLILFNKSP